MKSKHQVFGAALLIGQSILLNLVSIPVTAYIVRSLGPESYGQWAVASTLIAAGTCLANPGLSPLFSRAIAQNPEAAPAALAEQLSLRFWLAALVALLMLAVSAALGYPPAVVVSVAIAGAGLVLTRVASALADSLQALGHLKHFALSAFVAGLMLTIATAIAAGRDAGAVGLTIAYLTGPVVHCCLLFLFVRRLFPVRFGGNIAR